MFAHKTKKKKIKKKHNTNKQIKYLLRRADIIAWQREWADVKQWVVCVKYDLHKS